VSNIPGKLIVRADASAWRWTLLVIGLLLVALSLVAAFEFGLYKAGFAAVQAQAARSALQSQIDQLQLTQHQLRLQLAAAEEARVAQVRERTELARTIGELQAEVEREQQDVEFYRGLVAQPSQAAHVTVRVQQFHIAQSAPQKFVLRFTIDRVTQPEQAISGTLTISVDGTQNGTPATLDLATLSGGQEHLPFDFRYYAHMEQPITLPDGFKPDSVTLELQPARKGVSSYRQTFIWEVDPS
jgi:hypothetical protein